MTKIENDLDHKNCNLLMKVSDATHNTLVTDQNIIDCNF